MNTPRYICIADKFTLATNQRIIMRKHFGAFIACTITIASMQAEAAEAAKQFAAAPVVTEKVVKVKPAKSKAVKTATTKTSEVAPAK